MSLPSTRVDALSPHILEEIRRVRKTGFTLAPEAGTQRMRDVIQKEYKEEELLEAARVLFGLGWKSVKLYFMLGLPGETEEDLLGIVDLSRKVSAVGKHRRQVTASVSTFVPKPHTPFQWAGQVSLEETEARQQLLRRELRRAGIQFKWHEARLSWLEGVFARGDRRLTGPLISAYRLGCRFDGWTDQFRLDLWQQAFAQHGVDLLDENLAWDHLDSGVTKKWLQRDLAKAFEGTLTPDCSVERCSYCGACDFQTVRNVTYHLSGAKGAEHRGPDVDGWARQVLPEHSLWGTRQWQVMQEKRADTGQKSKGKGQSVEGKAPSPSPQGAGPASDSPVPSGNAEEWLAGDPNTIAVSQGDHKAGVVRIRVAYSRLEEARFLGARELITVLTRAARRAKLPVAYSQGWSAALFMRTWGWEASKFAFVNGIVLLAVGPATVNLSGWLCDRWYARGVTDAALRIAVIGAFIMVITGVIAPLMPTGNTAMLMFGVNAVGLAMITATGVTALLNMTPGEIRAQVVAFYYMAISLTGLLLGPTTIGILNDQVFGELGLKYSMALLPFVYGLPVLLLIPVTLRLYAGACAEILHDSG